MFNYIGSLSIWHKILLFVVSLFLLFFFVEVYNISSFRKHPNRPYFNDNFQNKNPLSFFRRLLILKSGSNSYNLHIKRFLLTINPANDYFNEYVYKDLFARLNEKDFIDNISKYPFDINNFHEDSLLEISNDKACDLIIEKLNSNSSNMLDVYENFKIESNSESLKRKRNVLISEINPGDVFMDFDLIKKIKSINNKNFKENLERCVSKHHEENIIKRINTDYDIVYFLLPTATKNSLILLKSFGSGQKIPITLLMNYLISTDDKEKKLAINYIESRLSELNEMDSALLAYFLFENGSSEDVLNLIKRLRKYSYYNALSAFHILVSHDSTAAEKLIPDLRKNLDSIFEKGALTFLIRYESYAAQKYIDDIFIGKAPRVVRLNIGNYMYNSDAIAKYREISTHDYLQTGKLFPPVYCNKPHENEVDLWIDYISKYQWSPVTDDAYFRLLYRLIVDGKISEAKKYLIEYNSKYFSDNDIFPMMVEIQKKLDDNKSLEFFIDSKNCDSEDYADFLLSDNYKKRLMKTEEE